MRWKLEPLGEVADSCLGKMLDARKNKGEPKPYLANINVRWGSFDLENLREMRFEEREKERYGLRSGDIVMCEGGEPGRCAIWKDDMPEMMIQKALHRIRPHPTLDSRFLFYHFLKTGRNGGFDGLFTGSTIKHLTGKNLAKLQVPVPPLPIQTRIADILSAYDDVIENNKRRMQLLEEAVRQLYREWFVRLRFPGHENTRIIDGVPEGWERKPISEFAQIVGGGTPKTTVPEYWEEGEVIWVTPTDVTRNSHFCLLDSAKKITEAGLKNSSAKLVPCHSILMTSRASVGFFALVRSEVCTNQGFISIVPNDKLATPFLLLQLSERVEEIRNMGTGSTYPEVSRGKFKEFKVSMPSAKTISIFSEFVSPMFDQLWILKQQNQKLRAARDLLLPKLMNGEIEV